MGAEVYANGNAISCKEADGKSVCAFPDVCFTPPQTPATPPGVPIPYPNTGMARDTTDGSKNVKLKGKEVMLKDKSYYKKSSGDEAGCAPKKNVITSTNRGKVYYNSWSMDVKFEGENVVRHLDLTTHNHASKPGATPPWANTETGAFATCKDCEQDRQRIKEKCTGDKAKDCPKPGPNYKKHPCVEAKRCQLVPKEPKSGCCPGQTGHHLIPKRAFKGRVGYNQANAPCVCAEGFSWHRNDASIFPAPEKTHPDLHDIQDYIEREAIDSPAPGRKPDAAMAYSEMRDMGIAAHQAVFPDAGCNPNCLKAQLDAYHRDEVKVGENELVRSSGGLRRLEQISSTMRDPAQLNKARELLAAIRAKVTQAAKLATKM